MVKPIVSAINNLKTMGGGHAVHERQAILSTTVVISPYGERERADPQRGVAIITLMLSCKSAITSPQKNDLCTQAMTSHWTRSVYHIEKLDSVAYF